MNLKKLWRKGMIMSLQLSLDDSQLFFQFINIKYIYERARQR